MGAALHAGKEHHSLRSPPNESQFTFQFDDSGTMFIRYTEDVCSKTNQGGLKHRRRKRKIVDIYPVPDSPRDPVALIEKYLSLLPPNRKSLSLYLHCKKKLCGQ